LDKVKVVLSIQVLNSLINGVLGVILPLMMKERNIDVVTIGFVFASVPMIFQLGRMFFATVSDFFGRKIFFILNGFLNVVSSLIYYLAHTALEFLFGKVMESTKDASLWSVNRAFLLEKSVKKWRALVHLRTVAYISSAAGCLIAGFLVAWLLYEGTLILCAVIGAFIVPLSLFLVSRRKKDVSVKEALRVLDFRKKKKVFKTFLALFFVMGLSFGFVSGYVFPLFLSDNGFGAETVGMLLGVQILLAGLVSYAFAGRFKIQKLVLVSGLLYTFTLFVTGFSRSILAGVFIVAYGLVEGLLGIGQEGILSRIANKESYGTDIGLLWMGHHIGRTFSLAASGILIKMWGFTAPFLLSAFVFCFFYVISYFTLNEGHW